MNDVTTAFMYSLLIRYSFILGSQSVDFLATWAEITIQPRSKQVTFYRGDFMYHRFLLTAWLAPKVSNLNEYQMSRQCVLSTPNLRNKSCDSNSFKHFVLCKTSTRSVCVCGGGRGKTFTQTNTHLVFINSFSAHISPNFVTKKVFFAIRLLLKG
jgi:hypothetical protein